MRVKKFIKLINSERTNSRLASSVACVGTSTDFCQENVDIAQCSINSYDVCNKDLAACYNNGYDYCDTQYDTDACIGSYDYN